MPPFIFKNKINMKNIRNIGYYWIHIQCTNRWVVAYFNNNNDWMLDGEVLHATIDKVNENQIKNDN